MINVIILAGGGGTRLWPLSRSASPKQLRAFIGRETLLQKTYRRVRQLTSSRHIFVATSERHAHSVRRQIPGLTASQLSLEPAKRDTAAAIGLAALRIARRNPHATVAMANADHVILDERAYIQALQTADRVIGKHPEQTVLLGIQPTYPETGYGYIKMGKRFGRVNGMAVYRGLKFIEKPPLRKAQQFVKKPNYVWNPAMFVWRVDSLLELFRTYLPVHFRHLQKIATALGTRKERQVIAREFAGMPSVSIDYGIMEKLSRMLVIPVSMGWADIGHWRTVHEITKHDPAGNAVRGTYIGYDTRDTLVFNFGKQLVATAGLRKAVVVVTQDAVLVADREHAQDVKRIVEQLKKRKLSRYL